MEFRGDRTSYVCQWGGCSFPHPVLTPLPLHLKFLKQGGKKKTPPCCLQKPSDTPLISPHPTLNQLNHLDQHRGICPHWHLPLQVICPPSAVHIPPFLALHQSESASAFLPGHGHNPTDNSGTLLNPLPPWLLFLCNICLSLGRFRKKGIGGMQIAWIPF